MLAVFTLFLSFRQDFHDRNLPCRGASGSGEPLRAHLRRHAAPPLPACLYERLPRPRGREPALHRNIRASPDWVKHGAASNGSVRDIQERRMLSTRQLHFTALGTLLAAAILAGAAMPGEASAQIVLKQTNTYAPRISASEQRRYEAERRAREQRARDNAAANQRFHAERRRILEEQRTGRSILFGGGSSSRRTRSTAVSR